MRNEFTQYIVERVGVRSGAELALRFLCAKPAPFIQTDWTMLRKT
ncbi:MAG TPA: hypothetical protein VJX74_00225 [Blastocatellia bacterium]|nr:hypothetical protein [Blastocatellia bacterium]